MEDPALLQSLLGETTAQLIQDTLTKMKDLGFSTVVAHGNKSVSSDTQPMLGGGLDASTLPTSGFTTPILPTPKSVVSDPILPTPKSGVSDPLLPTPGSGVSDPILPTPKSGVSDPLLPTPGSGVSDLILPTPKSGVSDPILSTPGSGVSDPILPTPKSGVSDPNLPLPKSGVSDPILPTPKSGVSDPNLPLPKSGVSDPILPTPKSGVSEPILPTPKSSVSVSTLPIPGSGIVTPAVSAPGCGITSPTLPSLGSDTCSSQRQQIEKESCIEIEVHGPGPEGAEGGKAWKLCKKNPGHLNFIPAPGFQIHHMPKDFQNDVSFEWIKLTIALTVRLRVAGSSTDRPKDRSYYSVPSGGTRVGSGMIGYARPIDGECPCHDCMLQPQLSRKSWAIGIRTGRHVVFDTQEILKTTVDVNYNDEESRADGRIKSLSGFREILSKSVHDWCYFECITHDEELASTISKQGQQWVEIRQSQMTMESLDMLSKVVIVSHPHGRSKQVTVGEVKHWKGSEIEPWPVGYNADTCPGSSGAPVCVLGRTAVDPDNHLPFDFLLHCMGNGVGKWNTGNIVL